MGALIGGGYIFEDLVNEDQYYGNYIFGNSDLIFLFGLYYILHETPTTKKNLQMLKIGFEWSRFDELRV